MRREGEEKAAPVPGRERSRIVSGEPCGVQSHISPWMDAARQQQITLVKRWMQSSSEEWTMTDMRRRL